MEVRVKEESIYYIDITLSERERNIVCDFIQNPPKDAPTEYRKFCELLFNQLNPSIGVPASDP